MLSSLISPADIKVGLQSTDKEECFAELLEVIVAKNPGLNRSQIMDALLVREEKMSTAVCPFVAVPHAICDSINKTSIAIGISKTGIEFESVELGEKNPLVNIIIEILFDSNNTEIHLHVLRDILQLVQNPEFVKNILNANASSEIYDIINSMEN